MDVILQTTYTSVFHSFQSSMKLSQWSMSRALGVIRRYCNRLWIFCGDYAFRVFDRHPRGKRDIVEDQSKAKLLPPMCTKTFIYDILYCLK